MSPTRRNLIKAFVGIGAAASLPQLPALAAPTPEPPLLDPWDTDAWTDQIRALVNIFTACGERKDADGLRGKFETTPASRDAIERVFAYFDWARGVVLG